MRSLFSLRGLSRPFFRIYAILCAAILSSVVVSPAAAVDTHAGIQWLLQHQDLEGSWGNSQPSATRSAQTTAAVLETLALFREQGSAYAAGLAWLRAQDERTTEAACWKASLLGVADQDLGTALDDLLSLDSGPGWPAAAGSLPEALDTALALRALVQTGGADSTVVQTALGLLSARQNADGGWGFGSNGSNAFLTAQVLETLQQLRGSFAVEPSRQDALGYLRALAGQDGTIGADLVSTAAAYGAAIGAGENVNASFPSTEGYLTGQQQVDGSWEGDAYTTAVVLKALSFLKPNLAVSSADISVSNPFPVDGERVTVVTTVHNDGPAAAGSVLVRLYDGAPGSGGAQIGQDLRIAHLSGYGSEAASLTWDTTQRAGSRELVAVVDELQEITEIREDDNRAGAPVLVTTVPDLVVSGGDIRVEPAIIKVTDEVEIAATVRNQGQANAAGFEAELFLGPPSSGGISLGAVRVSSLGGGEHADLVWRGSFPQGDHRLYVVVDGRLEIREASETNNLADIGLFVYPAGGDLPDLSVSSLSITPNTPRAGETATITATLFNGGSADVAGGEVAIQAAAGSGGNVALGTVVFSTLAPGESTVIALDVSLEEGPYTLTAKVDPSDAISELNELNNLASIAVRVLAAGTSLPDLELNANDLQYFPSDPTTLDTVTVHAIVRNLGNQTATGPGDVGTGVTLFDGDPNLGGQPVGGFYAGSIAPGAEVPIAVMVLLPPGVHQLYLMADPGRVVDEIDESNNTLSFELEVFPPQPDLTATMNDLSFAPASPGEGQAVTISATVRNPSTIMAENVRVILRDGPVDTGTLLLDTVIPRIAGHGWVAVQTAAQLAVGDHLVTIQIDPEDAIQERSETNNTTANSFAVLTQPDLAIAPVDLAITPAQPMSNKKITLAAVVRNIGGSTASAVTVAFFDGDPDAGGLSLGEPFTIHKIFGEGEVRVEKSFFLEPGIHEVYVALDPDGLIPEQTRSNNAAVVTVTVGSEAAVSFGGGLVLSPSAPIEGEPTAILTSVRSAGTGAVENIQVTFSDGPLEAGGTVIDVQAIASVTGGIDTPVTSTASFSGGYHEIFAEIGLSDENAPASASSGRIATLGVYVPTSAGDLVVKTGGMAIQPASPIAGSAAVLSATVWNYGGAARSGVEVAFYDEQEPTPTLLGLARVNVAAGGSAVAQVTALLSQGTHIIMAAVDPNHREQEARTANNVDRMEIKVLEGGIGFYDDSGNPGNDVHRTTGSDQVLQYLAAGFKQSLRTVSVDPVSVKYSFAGLSPGAGYRLTVVAVEDPSGGRTQKISADGVLLVGTYAVPEDAPATHTVFLPKDLYQDGAVTVAVDAGSAAGAIVSEVYLVRDSGQKEIAMFEGAAWLEQQGNFWGGGAREAWASISPALAAATAFSAYRTAGRTSDPRYEVLRQRLLSLQAPDYSWEDTVSTTASVVIALVEAGLDTHGEQVGGAVQWLIRQANADGGWGTMRGIPSQAYVTGQALAALMIAGESKSLTVVTRGVQWLKSTQNPTGYWGWDPGAADNAHIGPWPAIGLTLATSFTDSGAAWARTRYLNLHESSGYYSYLESQLRMLIYCGSPLATVQHYANSLLGVQSADGGWLGHPLYHVYPDYHMTARSMESIAKAGLTGPKVDRGFSWIANHLSADGSPTNLMMELTPPLSGWAVMALQQSGSLASSAVLKRAADTLVAAQNYWNRGLWTYGFFADDHGGTAASAHVIPALLTTPYYTASTARITTAAQFLQSAQSADGGWPNYKGASPSLVYETGLILTALLKWGAGTISLDSQMYVRGFNWLFSKQGLDGGWGNTRDTAQALMALASEGRHPVEVSRAKSWLLNAQNQDGGWGSTTGQASIVDATAQALIALAAAGEQGVSIAEGVGWLLAVRNPDRGWGIVPQGASSAPGSTALAVWALAVSKFTSGVELEILFNKPVYYPSDLVSMVINPLNKSVDEITLGGALQDQYGATATLEVERAGETFVSEYPVAPEALPGINTVSFLAFSDDAQGAKSAAFIVKSFSGQLPDLTMSSGDISFEGSSPRIGDEVVCATTLHNTGPIDARNVTVRAYRGTEASASAQIGGDLFVERVPGQGTTQVTFSWIADASSRQILVVVDPDNGVAEAVESNNSASQWLLLDGMVALADLRVVSTDVTVEPAHPYSGESLTISATVRNVGTAVSAPTILRFSNGDPAAGGVAVGADLVVPAIAPDASASVAVGMDTAGLAGRVYLYALADPANGLAEISESNNKGFTYVDLQQMTLPDLFVLAAGIVASPATPMEGESVTVSVPIKNRGVATASVMVALYDGDPQAGGFQIAASQVLSGILRHDEQRTVTFTWSTTGAGGAHTLYAMVDPMNAIGETHEDNNQASAAVAVEAGGLSVSVSAAPGIFGANAVVPIVVSATSGSSIDKAVVVDLALKDSLSATVAQVGSYPITLAGGASRQLLYSWNTGGTLAGNYTVSASLMLDGRPAAAANAPLTIAVDSALSASVVTDKSGYRANDTARITWGVASASANHDFTNLTVALSVADSTGTVLFTDQRAVSSLVRGQRLALETHWGVASRPPGAYPLSVRVTAGPVLLAQAGGTLIISAAADPKALLAGTISALPQVIFSGETETVGYSIRNIGNRDLSQVNLSVKVISADQQTVHAEVSDATVLPMGAEYAASQSLSAAGLSAADYLTVLVAEIDGVSATLAGTYFRIQGAPSAPSVNSPAAGSKVATFAPALIVNNAADPNTLDKLTYFFEIYADSALTQPVAAAGPIAEGQGTTGWQLPVVLEENARYWWHCRAYDGWSYGDWMLPVSLAVNTVNDPPGLPTVDQPQEGQSVSALQPLLVVKNASDPDSTSLTYNFLVASDAGMANVVDSAVGVFETAGTTAWQLSVPLVENTRYWWSAQADDWFIEGPWMAPVSFFVNTANDAPTAPVPFSPAPGVETGATVTLEVQNATDPDSAVLTYVFEIDTDPAFTTTGAVTSPELVEGAGTTSWVVPVALAENTRYFWRSRASDGEADGPWSAVSSLFVNTTNDPPGTPSLDNPSNNGEVILLQPTLSVHNALDPDGDALTYEVAVFGDADLGQEVVSIAGLPPDAGGLTAWCVTLPLAENARYWWRARAFDGELAGAWSLPWTFVVNTANDPPTAPVLVAPASGASVALLQPVLSISNAADPEGVPLTYQFEVYGDAALTTLAASATGIATGAGATSWTLPAPLQDNHQYWWRCRAFDGDRSGPWMATATFTLHVSTGSIVATINFDPDTLNLGSNGTWVTVYVELPAGYNVRNIGTATVKLNGVVAAETKPVGYGDEDRDGIADVMFKFRRSAVEALLIPGEHVVVQVTGKVGSTLFEGVDIIRVIH